MVSTAYLLKVYTCSNVQDILKLRTGTDSPDIIFLRVETLIHVIACFS